MVLLIPYVSIVIVLAILGNPVQKPFSGYDWLKTTSKLKPMSIISAKLTIQPIAWHGTWICNDILNGYENTYLHETCKRTRAHEMMLGKEQSIGCKKVFIFPEGMAAMIYWLFTWCIMFNRIYMYLIRAGSYTYIQHPWYKIIKCF